ncbi:MAG TPA: hypothetical protein VF796_22870, partial [Humisphaera sp.]
FRLEADAATGRLVDRSGRVAPVAKGATVVPDDRFGSCLKLADAAGVMIPDGGTFDFAGGMTLDAWVFLEEPPPARGPTLAVKVGSFAWDLGNGKLNTTWLTFPTEPIATTAPAQYKYFPVGGETINGLLNVPVGRWVKLTATYDEGTGAVVNLVDGVVDRHRYRYRGPERMQCDPARPLVLFQGLTKARVGPVTLRAGRPRVVPPSMEAYANALPWESKVLLTLDHLDADLPLPVEVTLVWEKPNGPAATLKTMSLASHARVDVELDMPTWRNVTHTLMVRATAGGRQVFSRNLPVSAAQPAGNVAISPDRLLVRDGKPLYPLVLYHAMPHEFPTVAGLGFNVLINDFCLTRTAGADRAKYDALQAESLDAAAKHNLLLLPAASSTYNKLRTVAVTGAHPAALGWYAADEPWGDLAKLVDSYNTLKLLNPDLPAVIVQNNCSRLQETAMGADIVGVDPYPVPNVSLRGVPDNTRAAIRAVAGRKPVWTVIPQYGAKLPSRDELRCMAWLAVAAGADGVGFFCWDERVRDPKTREVKGWYTPEHPERVEDLRAVVSEMRRLERVLLARPSQTPPKLDPPNPAIHASVRSAGGKRYLVVANDSRVAESAALTVDGVADVEAACLSAADAPPLAVKGGVAKVALPPLGVAVYDLTPQTR